MNFELHTADPIQSIADLTLVHPAIATLEATIDDHVDRVNIATLANKKGLKALQLIESSVWTDRIENTLGKPEELVVIRSQYDESALQFMSAWLMWVAARDEMMEGRKIINDVIVDTLISLDRFRFDPLLGVFKARLVAAAEVHGRSLSDNVILHENAHKKGREVAWLEPSQRVMALVDNIQADAFKVMIAGLAANARHDLYTTAFAVEDKSRPSLQHPSGRERRYIDVVPFVDCVNSRHPESAKLFELLSLVKGAVCNCHRSENAFISEQQGSVNERQHSERLVQFLHEEKAFGKGEELEKQVKAQDERRYVFESRRQQFVLNVRYLRTLLGLIVKALQASAIEAEALLSNVGAFSTIDEKITLRIMLNNCLAVDASLRTLVMSLLNYERRIKDDISNGAGTRAVASRFDVVAQHYSHQVKQRKEALALTRTRGQNAGA